MAKDIEAAVVLTVTSVTEPKVVSVLHRRSGLAMASWVSLVRAVWDAVNGLEGEATTPGWSSSLTGSRFAVTRWEQPSISSPFQLSNPISP